MWSSIISSCQTPEIDTPNEPGNVVLKMAKTIWKEPRSLSHCLEEIPLLLWNTGIVIYINKTYTSLEFEYLVILLQQLKLTGTVGSAKIISLALNFLFYKMKEFATLASLLFPKPTEHSGLLRLLFPRLENSFLRYSHGFHSLLSSA